jgi:hypothetical protein
MSAFPDWLPKSRGDSTQSEMIRRLRLGKASVDVNVSGEVVVNHTDAAVEDLQRLKSLGVPREQLLETFGYSGLDRYEKLLAERQPKVNRTHAG